MRQIKGDKNNYHVMFLHGCDCTTFVFDAKTNTNLKGVNLNKHTSVLIDFMASSHWNEWKYMATFLRVLWSPERSLFLWLQLLYVVRAMYIVRAFIVSELSSTSEGNSDV